MRYLFAVGTVCLSTSALCQAIQPVHKTQVAQMAFLAQLAPKACPEMKTDDEAVAAYMAGSQLNERELLDSYGAATKPVADAFSASAARDPEAACEQVWDQLGDDGLGLVVTTKGDP